METAPLVRVRDLGRHEGRSVTVQGWVYNRTDKGKLQFIQVRDGTGVVQAVAFQKDLDEAAFDAARTLTQESSVAVTGLVRADARAPGGFELALSGLAVRKHGISHDPAGPLLEGR